MDQARIGVFGLGTMGSALVLNLADRGIPVAAANRHGGAAEALRDRAGAAGALISPARDISGLVAALARPRAVLLMVPSGAPVDELIAQATALLDPGDVIIDAGNSDFNDTRRRAADLAASGLEFVGMGVSGGEDGARHGSSMMVGGSKAAWTRLEPVLTAIAARFDGDPCIARVGPDGAGHFVKTVHNGIEYADMQIIAEVYGLLRDGAGWGAGRIGALFDRWNGGPLASFLVEITGKVLAATDAGTGRPLVDMIADSAGQKGTGRWTVIEALKLGQSANTIEAAVAARSWSADAELRMAAAAQLPGPGTDFDLPALEALEQALLAGRILSHAQGFDILAAASREYTWSLDLARIAEIWRAGCIIRSALLNDLATALHDGPPQGALVLAPALRTILDRGVPALRQVVGAGVAAGLPVPSLAAALAWYDSIRQARGTANLIQAQRDFFGAHGFRRTDAPGDHHGDWS